MATRENRVERIQNVISQHDADANGNSTLTGYLQNGIAASFGVYTTAIGDDLDILFDNVRQDGINYIDEVSCVTGLRVFQFLLLHDGHGHLSEVVHHHVVYRRFGRGAANLVDRRRGQIAPETLAGSNTDSFFHRKIRVELIAHKQNKRRNSP